MTMSHARVNRRDFMLSVLKLQYLLSQS